MGCGGGWGHAIFAVEIAGSGGVRRVLTRACRHVMRAGVYVWGVRQCQWTDDQARVTCTGRNPFISTQCDLSPSDSLGWNVTCTQMSTGGYGNVAYTCEVRMPVDTINWECRSPSVLAGRPWYWTVPAR